jgi:hypothetical protein
MGLVSSNACRGYDYKWLIDLSSSRGSVRSASGRTCTLLYMYVFAKGILSAYLRVIINQ